MPRNTESLVRVVGRGQFLLFTRMAKEAELLRSATVLIQLAAEPKRLGTARPGPLSFNGTWRLRELLLTLLPS